KGGSPGMATLNVPAGNAEVLATMLNKRFENVPSVMVRASGSNALVVYGYPSDILDIRQIVEGTDKGVSTRVFDVGGAEPKDVAAMLMRMFPGDVKSGAPSIEAHPGGTGVIVRGTSDQMKEIADAIKAATGSSGFQGGQVGSMRIITLDKDGSGAAMAEALYKTLTRMRSNPVEIVNPSGGNGPREGPSQPP